MIFSFFDTRILKRIFSPFVIFPAFPVPDYEYMTIREITTHLDSLGGL